MAQRMGRFTTSSDRDNFVNIRSTSSSSLLNRRSLRPLSITATAFMIVIAFSSLSSVLSFPVSPSSWNKITLAQRQGQPQLLQSSSFAFTIKQRKHPLHTRFGAASSNDCKDEDPTASSANTPARSTTIKAGSDDGYDGLGEYDPSENLPQTERGVPNVGDPQLRVKEKDWSVTNILKELAAIQQQGPQKYCILGTRHCSYLHQQIIELLAYALVLSGNHVYTSGAPGTNAAAVRGALRAEREDLLTVVLPQSLEKQTKESQELLEKVDDLITMPQNDDMALDVASRICNSYLLSLTDQLVSFAFHESTTVIEANKEAKALDMLVTTLYLD